MTPVCPRPGHAAVAPIGEASRVRSPYATEGYRYSIGDRTPSLRDGDDGSLIIRIQHHPPEGLDEANWLPAPAGRFYLNTRAYMPRPEFLDGTYRLPAVHRIAHQAEASPHA